MSARPTIRRRAVARPLGLVLVLSAGASARGAEPAEDPVPVAMVQYGERRSDVCFGEVFLALVALETGAAIEPRLTPIALLSPALPAAPIGVMTGEGFFELDAGQRAALRAWLTNGGFLIASSGCSSPDWGLSFRREVEAMFPGEGEARLEPLAPTHAVFDTIYHIRALQRTAPPRAADADLPEPPPAVIDASPLEGLTIDGRLCLVFSPDGLNDTASFGGACCCCGTGEVIHARQMMANLVAFALAQRGVRAVAPDPAPTPDVAPHGTIGP